MYKPTLLIVVTVDWFFVSHRLPIAVAAQEAGYEVYVVTADTGRAEEIRAEGIHVINFHFDRSGTNIVNELKTILALTQIYKKIKPDIVHHVALKPCIYGSLAAKIAGVENVVNAITGLGYNFTGERRGGMAKLLLHLIRFSAKNESTHFIFQNEDDAAFISKACRINDNRKTLIKGCGVDLRIFSYSPEPENKKIRFVLPARILYDKGVKEYIDSAIKIREFAYGKAEFVLAGSLDTDNRAGISEEVFNSFLIDEYIMWVGYQKDMVSVLKNSHIVVLPSYREGIPKSLIEANAIGRPIITTNAPGCRECVVDGINGFIVPVCDVDLMAQRMLELINNHDLRYNMGIEARKIAEQEFSLEMSINSTLKIYNSLLK